MTWYNGITDMFSSKGMKTAAEGIKDGYKKTVNVLNSIHKSTFVTDGYVNVGSIDVVKDYPWGVHSNSQINLSEVPTIQLVEFQPQNGPMQEMLMYGAGAGVEMTRILARGSFSSVQQVEAIIDPSEQQKRMAEEAKNAVREINREDAYRKMYTATPTGNIYTLPYFSTYNHTITNSWKEADTFGGSLPKMFEKFASVLSNSYISITKRQEYEGIASSDFETSFQLFNTLSNDPATTIINNFKLLFALQHNNMPDKLSFATLLPPVLYSMTIPGVRFSPAVYIKTLTVENIGQVNKVDLVMAGEVVTANIPDAWNVSLVIQELLPESRSIFKQVLLNEKTIKVIGEGII